ncbi:ABATE domain-containing protein [Streptomyces sp. bgisy032]|uniref:ABATE domain-containing protein n=1 Tax=Streptomyces sp. bgisy032 TaxID=3413773 RepID=UPI003D71BAF3
MTSRDERLPDAIAKTVLPPAPGAERYRSLDFADTSAALPAGRGYGLLAAPECAMRWLTAHDLTTPDVRLYEVCAQRMRTLRGHVRALFAARVAGTTPPEDSLHAVGAANPLLTRPDAHPLGTADFGTDRGTGAGPSSVSCR